MNIVIVGAGALGRILGALLGQGGQSVSFVDVDEKVVAAINDKGVGMSVYDSLDPGEIAYVPARAVMNGKEIDRCDFVVMAVKSYHSLEAVKGIAHLVGKDSPVISLQNGLGHLEILESLVDRENIIAGFTFIAGTALGPGLVINDGTGKTVLGEMDGRMSRRLEEISRVFNSCGLATELVPDIIRQMWCKVIVHAAINSVSAVLRQKNGHLLESEGSISLMKRLVAEGEQVARACGIDLGGAVLHEMLLDSCKQTYNHLSPMLQDIINGRRTEVDSLNGVFYDYGRKHGIESLTHLTMLELVKSLETGSSLTEMVQERF